MTSRGQQLPTKQPFTEPVTSFAEQVTLLHERVMIVDDLATAEFHLQHLNYYRLGCRLKASLKADILGYNHDDVTATRRLEE